MNRRQVLTLLASGVSSSLLLPLAPSHRWRVGQAIHMRLGTRPTALRPDQHALIARIADLVLPASETPGALDVEVPAFIDLMLAEWHTDTERAALLKGLGDLDRRAGAGFLTLDEAAQLQLLTSLDGVKGAPGSAEQAFGSLKWLTLYGYFTSERVQREVLRTVVIPGRYDACVPIANEEHH